ncbi:MAG: FAD-binding protein, partial [Flavobacterium sp.]
MPKEILLQVSPEIAAHELSLKETVAKHLQTPLSDLQFLSVLKRSIDARQKSIKINLKMLVFFKDETFLKTSIDLPEY